MSENPKDVVITSALRTPIGGYRGALKNLSAAQLGSLAIKEVINKSNINAEEIDEVIMGHVLTAGLGQNPARQASIGAGVPVSKPAHIVNQVCGSGLRSVVSAYQSIQLGENKIVIAGGQENMSRATHAIFYREDKKFSENKLVDTMIIDGLMDAFNDYHMGITAENVAEKWNISREEQDNFSLSSQQKAQDAIQKGKFEDEIIKNINFKSYKDEHVRPNIEIKDLSKLEPAFKKNGTVTPGNSSGINDGAAAVLLMKRSEAEKRNLEPFAKIKSWASCGVDPSLMGSGPIPSSKKALNIADWKISDLDLIESNEAFAAQSLAVAKDLKIPLEIMNVNGGAIALGHPIGASGCRVVVTLLHEMKKRDLKKGLATLCIGGGMGIAMCFERD